MAAQGNLFSATTLSSFFSCSGSCLLLPPSPSPSPFLLTERLQVKKLDQQYKERMRINAVVKELELEMAEQDYQNEKRNAAKEFEEKKVNIHNESHS